MFDFLKRRSVTAVGGALFSFVLLTAVGANAATSAGPVHVGHTTSVIEDVKGQLGDALPKKIVQAEKVFFNEAVITASKSAIIIQFRDGSIFELGPNGLMTLDELVFNPFEGKSVKVMTLIQGSFRYVSGYVATDSLAQLNTPSGTIGIRGSTMSGFHYPGKPEFFHVSKGVATYRNEGGERSVRAGQSVAVVDRATPAIEPERMPPAVASQALSHIETSLGKASETAGSQTLTPEQRAADAAANAIPIAQQQQDLPATTTTTPVAEAAASANIPDIPLLSEAAKVGVLDARNTETTAQQQAFLAKAEQAIPDAAAKVDAITAADQAKNVANVAVGTTEVVAGSSENADTAEQIGTLVQAAVGANPDATALIATTAVKGSSTNSAVDTTAVATEAAKGAVAGAGDAGADLAVVMVEASNGIVTGGMLGGLTAAAAAEATMKGAISGAILTGSNINDVTKSTAQGAVVGAAKSGLDTAAASQAMAESVISSAAAAGRDLGEAAKSVMQGITKGASDSDLNVTTALEAVTRGVLTSASKTGGDMTDITVSVTEGALDAAQDYGIDPAAATAVVQQESAAAEVALITTAAPAPTLAPTVPAPPPVDPVTVEAPEPENPSQNNASPS